MSNFIHRFFNPHCPHCVNERICNNCEVLQLLLEQERHEKSVILNTLLEMNKPKVEETQPIRREEPIKSNFTPWRTKQRELENADREKAEALKKRVEEIKMEKVDVSDLEKEIGVVNGNE